MSSEPTSPETEPEGCTCDCECCQAGKCQHKPDHHGGVYWHMRNNDTVGAIFLGLLSMLLLVFLVRANRRNRELLLDVIQMRRGE